MKKLAFTFDKKGGRRKSTHRAQVSFSCTNDVFGMFIYLWKSVLTSRLPSKDKVEILKLLIIAFVVISHLIVFVWLTRILLDHL